MSDDRWIPAFAGMTHKGIKLEDWLNRLEPGTMLVLADCQEFSPQTSKNSAAEVLEPLPMSLNQAGG